MVANNGQGGMRKDKQLAIVREELEALAQRIRANHQKAGQVASGRTLKSIRVDVSGDEGTLYGRAYFGVLETGRRAGRVPRNFQQIILQWMKDKGVHADPIPYKRKASATWQPKYTAQERGDRSLAGAIARKIQTEGSSLYRSGGRTDIYSNEIPVTTERILQRLALVFSKDIESETINYITLSKL